ncbi:WD40 repeat domain-containing protein [Leptodesmis sp.]|uniref:WD40 repeat domain-containing protein n=1 Tax=Leptodesmis sp. TaxID=3100501 RepID=UPI0040534E9A
MWKCDSRPDFDKLKRTLLGHTDTVLSVALTKDGNVLVNGSVDQTVRIWDSTTFKAPLILTGQIWIVHAPIHSIGKASAWVMILTQILLSLTSS